MNDKEYSIKVGINSLKHLGVGLYSSVPAIISEAVANAWDADAKNVHIAIHQGKGEIVIQDDGCGMDVDDCNAKYLTVGYERRESGLSITNSGRHVMGRKGIGKLSLFSLANKIEVYTSKKRDNGTVDKNAFLMDYEDIVEKIKDSTYNSGCPLQPLPVDSIDFDHGTKLVLRNLKKDILRSESYIRKRLARRFSVIGTANNFRVFINSEEITPEDRDYLRHIQYLWVLGSNDEAEEYKCYDNIINIDTIPNVVNAEKNWTVSGWVGTFDKQKHVDDDNNDIIVMAWGKAIQEDILKEIKKGGMFTKYLVGQINADFLDYDDYDDIAVSSRQTVKEDDERYMALYEYVKITILNTIGNQWTDLRVRDATIAALSNETIKEWFEGLDKKQQPYAKALFRKIESFKDPDNTVKPQLYRSGIIAFEYIAFKGLLSELENINTDEEMANFVSIIGDLDNLEAVYYFQIVKSRMEVLKKINSIIDEDQKESVIRDFIFEHLWLLDPSWERASTNTRVERKITTEFDKITSDLSEEEKSGRIDIKYRTAVGKHVIIELKRYSVKPRITELTEQVLKYKSALRKCLIENFQERDPPIEIICVLGEEIQDPFRTKEEIKKTLEASNIRQITYDTLISGCQQSYDDYLEQEKKLSRLAKIIESLPGGSDY